MGNKKENEKKECREETHTKKSRMGKDEKWRTKGHGHQFTCFAVYEIITLSTSLKFLPVIGMLGVVNV